MAFEPEAGEEAGMTVGTASDAAELFVPLFAAQEGHTLAVAHLDRQRRPIELVVYPSTEANHADFPLRRILEDALRLGADGLIVAHTNPTGDTQPSRDDLEATRELASTTRSLGIQLHDHLIFAGGEFASLRQLGLL